MRHELAPVETPEQWAILHSIRRAVLFEGRHADVVYDENHHDDRTPGNQPYLLTADGRPVGCVRFDDRGDGSGVVRLVAVVADEQRRGHGRALDRLITERAHSSGMTTLFVNAAPEAVGYYEKTGWSRHAWDASELDGLAADCVQMRKAL
ncbi:GNAT family N-acetyltransferase [Pelagibacterium xiamenense]|uniref:GNAT family N-acetyltransferase n=1 Tax=Pelagibacterium xiamenense TaxID=2901140 RepID=UPI001E611AE8|nr:GNAT family N-acetyltransferase [Pelagibacterium xiamenense]MCD7060067.1 GNAT family N-acetyltransferase [Pelagibacterium xiamenense]